MNRKDMAKEIVHDKTSGWRTTALKSLQLMWEALVGLGWTKHRGHHLCPNCEGEM